MNERWRFMRKDLEQDTLPSPRAGGKMTRLDKAVGAVDQVDMTTRVLEGLNDDVGEAWAARRADGRTIDVRLLWMDDEDKDRDRSLFIMPEVSEEVGSVGVSKEGGAKVYVGARGSQPQSEDLPGEAGTGAGAVEALSALTTLTEEQVTNAMRSVDVYYSNPLNLRVPAGRPVAGTLNPSRVRRGETGLVELRRPMSVSEPSVPQQQQPISPDAPRPSARPWLRPNQAEPAQTVPPPITTAGADPLVPTSALATRPCGGGQSPRKERALLLEAETRAIMDRVSVNVIEAKNKNRKRLATMLALKVKKATNATPASSMTPGHRPPGTAAGSGAAAGAGQGGGSKCASLLEGPSGKASVLIAASSRGKRGTNGTVAASSGDVKGGGGGGGRMKKPTSKPTPASFLLFKQFCENGGGMDNTGALKDESDTRSSTSGSGQGGSPAKSERERARGAQSPRLPFFLANVN
jgi:hypothetical protein